MNTRELKAVLRKIIPPSIAPTYVVARDQLEKRKTVEFPSVYICNLDDSRSAGSHWVTIYFINESQCEYFDSYGLRPMYDTMTFTMLKFSSTVVYSKKTLQGINSSVCGQLCLLFIFFRTNDFSYEYFLNFCLELSKELSDHMINLFINSISGEDFQTHSRELSPLPYFLQCKLVPGQILSDDA